MHHKCDLKNCCLLLIKLPWINLTSYLPIVRVFQLVFAQQINKFKLKFISEIHPILLLSFLKSINFIPQNNHKDFTKTKIILSKSCSCCCKNFRLHPFGRHYFNEYFSLNHFSPSDQKCLLRITEKTVSSSKILWKIPSMNVPTHA